MTLTPIPEPVDAARRVLTAVLATDPAPDDALVISEALAVLADVTPPYPPLGPREAPIDPATGLARALALLGEAIAEAGDIPALCRYGETVMLLRRAPSARPPVRPT